MSMTSVTKGCEKIKGMVNGRRVSVVDTPGLFDTHTSEEMINKEIMRCITMSSPGPHAIVMVLQLGRFTEEERKSVEKIQELFKEHAADYTIVLFTHADDLDGKPIQDFIKKQDQKIQNFIVQFGGRYVAFNNKKMQDQGQVLQLIKMIDNMVAQNGNRYYTNHAFQMAEKALSEFQEDYLVKCRDTIEREKNIVRQQYEAEWNEFQKRMTLQRQVQIAEKRVISRNLRELTEEMNNLQAEGNR
ncbi:GIMA4 GTPase, partial [Amia calva]|nr:GIMA4 GTPase [Amia calva]